MSRAILVFTTSTMAAQQAVLDELSLLEGIVTASCVDGDELVVAVEIEDARAILRRVRDVVATHDELSRESYRSSAEAARLFVRPA